MKLLTKHIRHLCIIVLILNTIVFCSCGKNELFNLGIPTKSYYPDNLIARCVWDMTVFDNNLYIGCGDYNNNSGPTPVLYSDLDDIGNWNEEAVLQDEQIGRFLLIDGKLTIPDFDPVGSPQYGTYYQLENGIWNTYYGIPDGQHNFDLIKFNNLLFAGIGAERGLTPIAASSDGRDFLRIPMYKNGEYVTTNGGECIRTHDFFILNNKLYANFWYENIEENRLISEIYRYDDGVFVFESELTGKLNTGMSCRNMPPHWAKAAVNNTLFLTTGYLYYTNDMNEFKMINFPEYARTYDLYLYEDTLYVLTASIKGKEYKVTVYSMPQGNINDLNKECSFDYPLHPTSFAVNDDNFFIALGEWNVIDNTENGTIIQVKRD